MNYLYIVLIFIFNIRIVFKREDRLALITANIIGIIIIGIMSIIFPKSLTRTKQEFTVINYLNNVEKISNEDIIEITPLSNSGENKKRRIFVNIKGKAAFIYYYKGGEIIGIEENHKY